MSVGGIGVTGYQAGEYKNRKTSEKTFGGNFASQLDTMADKKASNMSNAGGRVYQVYMKTDDMLYSGGNGTGLSFYIKYAENSTEEDPTVVAKGVDENGQEFEQTIHINKINPQSATIVEMRALEAYLGVDKNGGLSSLPPETGTMKLNDRRDFFGMFRQQIKDMQLLFQKSTADYYRYSMGMYLDFFNTRYLRG